jgi:prophage regulatory protein
MYPDAAQCAAMEVKMRVLVYPELKPVKGIGYSESHLRRLVKAGLFPKPIRLGSNRIAWPEHEVDAHLERLAAERDSDGEGA